MGSGTSSGKAQAQQASGMSAFQKATMGSKITRTGITPNGNGTWSFDIEGIGGGQILDETGGSRDPNAGRGGKVYSFVAWDADYSQIGPRQMAYGTLNQAKNDLKDVLRRHYGLFG